jgi:hypothetical protein
MSITFERCKDLQFVASVLANPKLSEALTDDFGPSAHPVDHPSVSYVAITDSGEFLGIAIVNAHSVVQWEVHNLLLPRVGWKKRIQVGREFFNWLWVAGCKRVIGKALASNRYAVKYNEIVGMERIGVNRKAFMKNGELVDEVWWGISAP